MRRFGGGRRRGERGRQHRESEGAPRPGGWGVAIVGGFRQQPRRQTFIALVLGRETRRRRDPHSISPALVYSARGGAGGGAGGSGGVSPDGAVGHCKGPGSGVRGDMSPYRSDSSSSSRIQRSQSHTARSAPAGAGGWDEESNPGPSHDLFLFFSPPTPLSPWTEYIFPHYMRNEVEGAGSGGGAGGRGYHIHTG